MSKQRKTIILTVFLLCFVLLAGCSAEPSKESATADEVSAQETATDMSNQQFSDYADTSVDVLRKEIGQSTAQLGVAYIGYFDGAAADETGVDFEQWFYSTSSPLTACYPFVSEIDDNHTIGTQGHLYCVVAKTDDASISVSRIGDDKPLYTAENGDPILVFCNLDGDAQKADTVVTVKASDGNEYRWEPTLDNTGYPNLLIGNERELLSWDFTPVSDADFDLDAWLAEGWMGPTAVGLAYDSNGIDWRISTWDNSKSYCLSFYLNESDAYDGEVVLECFYAEKSAVQARWQGKWRIETEAEKPSRLYLELTLTDGADMTAFEACATVSESYLAMIPQSGNNLLLVADNVGASLPVFPEGAQAAELTLSDE